MRAFLILPILTFGLVACATPPNVEKVSDYSAPPAPPIRDPSYNPYSPYGSENATWAPPTFNRDGTVVKPAEPSSQDDRADYEHAPWATGAEGGSQFAPPGTF